MFIERFASIVVSSIPWSTWGTGKPESGAWSRMERLLDARRCRRIPLSN
jgi:hypothetical protein